MPAAREWMQLGTRSSTMPLTCTWPAKGAGLRAGGAPMGSIAASFALLQPASAKLLQPP